MFRGGNAYRTRGEKIKCLDICRPSEVVSLRLEVRLFSSNTETFIGTAFIFLFIVFGNWNRIRYGEKFISIDSNKKQFLCTKGDLISLIRF